MLRLQRLVPKRLFFFNARQTAAIPNSPPNVDSAISNPSPIGVSAGDLLGNAEISSIGAIEQITKVGELKMLGLCGSSPSGLFQSLLEVVHVNSGLPWWFSIVSCTVLVKFALLPILVKSEAATTRLANIKPLMTPIQEKIAKAKAAGDQNATSLAMRDLQGIFKKEGVNPLSALWGVAQIPVFISIFFALRSMADLPVPGFENGGIGWSSNLAEMDPTYVLPIIASASMYFVLRNGMQAQADPTKALMIGRFMILVSFAVTCSMPAALFYYWIPSNLITLLQVSVLRNEKVRRVFKIPLRVNLDNHAKSLSDLKSGISASGMLGVKRMSFFEAQKFMRS